MIAAVVTPAASESDMHHITDVLKRPELKKGARVKADKGYASAANRQALKEEGLRDNIMHKEGNKKQSPDRLAGKIQSAYQPDKV